ncbi:MAG: hypothetical protein GC160_02770 [Acidobacteria bacterium]|nr:hypothetical protein [Acidobacteriota bacterium]
MAVEWKQDEWGMTAIVGEWLTLAANRARKEGETGWTAFVDGMPVGGRDQVRFDNADDAMHAAEKEARERCRRALEELGVRE